MATVLTLLTIGDLRGGRNNVDPSIALPEDQVVEALNVDWYQGLLGRRRLGAILVPISGAGVTFSGWPTRLIRHFPTAREEESELWAVDAGLSGGVARQVAGAWSQVTFADLPAGALRGDRVVGASFNGKLFLGYPSTLDRLHVWDGTAVRRTGLATAGGVSSIAAAAGTGITGYRRFRIMFTTQVGGVTTRRSELGPVVGLSITNQGGWVVGRPALIGEGETHWEIYEATTGSGSFDPGPYYLMATVPIGTTTYTETTPLASFPPAGATLVPVVGSYTTLPSAKYLMVDEARLILADSWNAPQYQSRVWWTPVLNDASGVSNDERLNLSLNPFIDFDPGDGGEITGLGGPLFDCPYVFKYDRIYKMVRTGLAQAPYRPVTVSKKCGAIHQDTIVRGEDETGNECIYFLSRRGPYRLGINGLQYCGRDIEDLWARISLADASGNTPAHGVYHTELKQVWWWIPLDGPANPNTKIVFDVKQGRFDPTTGVRRGWSRHDGESANAMCSVMYSRVTGATNSLDLKPYIGHASPGTGLWRCDVTPSNDNGTPYRGYLRTRIILPGQSVATHGGTIEGFLVGAPTGAAIRVSTIRDYGLEVRNADTVLTPQGTETRVILPLRDLAATDAAALQLEFGDPSPVTADWILDQLVLRIRREEDR